MLDHAELGAGRLADMLGPFPARLIGGAPDDHRTQMHKLELALLELTHFVGCVEALEDSGRNVHLRYLANVASTSVSDANRPVSASCKPRSMARNSAALA